MSFARLNLTMRAVSTQAQKTGEDVKKVAEESSKAAQQATEDLERVGQVFDTVRQSIANTLQVANSGKEMADQLLASFLGGIPKITSSGGSAIERTAPPAVTTTTTKSQTQSASGRLRARLPRATPTERSRTPLTSTNSARAVDEAKARLDAARARGASASEIDQLKYAYDLALSRVSTSSTSANPATGRLG